MRVAFISFMSFEAVDLIENISQCLFSCKGSMKRCFNICMKGEESRHALCRVQGSKPDK